MSEELSTLEQKLGYHFSDSSHLILALTHPSCSFEARQHLPDNQRLEFLGDAVLQMIVTLHLFELFPEADEGELTPLRARLVSRDSLALIARHLEIGTYLRLGRGEELNSGRTRDSNLADAVEAIIGAIHLDGGFQKAREAVLPWFISRLQESDGRASPILNPKGALQEWLQGQGGGTPTYDLLEASGPDHDRIFKVAVKSSGTVLAQGEGKSKKSAEAAAAAVALENLKNQK